MSIYYIDHVSGDDSNDGTSWGAGWKTLTNGATAARIAPGDEIRIAKSPDPTSIGSATWTDLSDTVTLASALTANIDLCQSAWTPVSNITCSTSATRKEGSLACSFVVGTSFTTGKIAYKTLTSMNLSAYQQISFWIQSSLALSGLQIYLCSDTLGNTPVDTFTLPAITNVNVLHPITIDKGGALGSAIQSIALYTLVDPGTPTILLDNILACKASSSADSLTLTSLISKNSAAYGGTDGWHGIQSINGTAVKLDNGVGCLPGAARGYTGTTETVTTYKRETIKLTATEQVQDSGTDLARIYFKFGYNTSTNEQDGETFLDGQCGSFAGLSIGARSFLTISRISAVRGSNGINLSASCYSNDISFGSLINSTSYGLSISATSGNSFSGRDASNNSNHGIYHYAPCCANSIIVTNANNNIYSGLYVSGTTNSMSADHRHDIANLKNNGAYGLELKAATNSKSRINTANNATAGVFIDYGLHYLNKSTIAEANEVTGLVAYGGGCLYSTLHDDTPLSHKIWMDGALITGQSAVKYTETGLAWKISPVSANRNSYFPVVLPIARVAVDSGSLVTLTAWFLRDSLDITGKMVLRGGQIGGLTSDVVDTISVGINTWEQLIITFTPTESGVVEVEAQVYGGTTNSVYVDSFQAA